MMEILLLKFAIWRETEREREREGGRGRKREREGERYRGAMNSFLFLFEVLLEGLRVLACLGKIGFGCYLLNGFKWLVGFPSSSH